jgi:RHS repeat-associated protein
LLGQTRVGKRNANGEIFYFLEDHLGSTRFVVDTRGKVVARYSYSPFGVPKVTEGTSDTDLLYTGEFWDPDVHLLYLRSRYYDPQLGRFLSPDPLPGSPMVPETFNQYVYVNNDPVNQVDPLGLQGWPPPPFYNPMREPWKYHPSIPPVERISPVRPAPPTPHSFTYYFARELWTMTSQGGLFHADTAWQHDFRALVSPTVLGGGVLFANDLLENLHQRDLKSGAESVLKGALPYGIEKGSFGMKPHPILGRTLGHSFEAYDLYGELRQGFIAPWLISKTKDFFSERQNRESSLTTPSITACLTNGVRSFYHPPVMEVEEIL